MGKLNKKTESKPVLVKAKGKVLHYGRYEFSDDELQKKGNELVDVLHQKRKVEHEKKIAMQEFKNTLGALDQDQYLVEQDIETGVRECDMDCLVYLEDVDGTLMKIYESIDFGVEVAREVFDYARDRHNFDFTEIKDFDSGTKKILYEGVPVFTVAMSDGERQMNIYDINNNKVHKHFSALNVVGDDEEEGTE